MKSILVTGGAGFVGSNLAIGLAGWHPDWQIMALDNLHRKGSELNLARLKQAGVDFISGDVRNPEDLESAGQVDALLECSAEPSVMSGVDGDTRYLVETNLTGAYNCLELARRDDAQFVFLSSSRVYPLGGLRQISTSEGESRFELDGNQGVPGVSDRGISENMPTSGARTLYGSTKLAAELLTEEFNEMFGLQTVVNRCGVIAGPWQMGKVDQGVFTHWMLSHMKGEPLSYFGFGGSGKQVRDLLHVEDLLDLVDLQLLDPGHWSGRTFNVGGGREISLSLRETTEICSRLTGVELEITPTLEDRAGDVPVYISDCSRLFEHSDWRPQRSAPAILEDIHEWIASQRDLLKGTLL